MLQMLTLQWSFRCLTNTKNEIAGFFFARTKKSAKNPIIRTLHFSTVDIKAAFSLEICNKFYIYFHRKHLKFSQFRTLDSLYSRLSINWSSVVNIEKISFHRFTVLWTRIKFTKPQSSDLEHNAKVYVCRCCRCCICSLNWRHFALLALVNRLHHQIRFNFSSSAIYWNNRFNWNCWTKWWIKCKYKSESKM